MKRMLSAAVVLFGLSGAAYANLSSPSSDVPSNAKAPEEAPRQLRAYAPSKLDPLTLSATMDSPGTSPDTPYLAGSSGRYGAPKGPILSSTLSGAYRAGVESEAQAESEKPAWGHKK